MKLDQCLFGYDDGHRLLASSLSLGSETSFLTELSDLAPGTVFSRSEGYWTGLPVPAIGRYVLMRTWPAPEMPRPGCVWTHALLIEPALLASIKNLSVLQTLAIRPATPLDRGRYREAVPVDFISFAEADLPVDDAIVRKLIASLYAMSSTTVEVASPGELDGPLFAVWSQQWPRLRRNFRFQTATSRLPRSTGSARFDITAVLANQRDGAPRSDDPDTPWLSAAARDVQEGANGSLRRFLWLYGRDVRKQRGSFRPLVEVKAIDYEAVEDSGKRLIEIVTDSFPALDDAAHLKQDLVDGVLVPPAQAELLRFVLSNKGEAVFPPPTSTGVARLAHFWLEKSDEILPLAEITADAEDSLGRSVFETLTSSVQMSEFWLLTRSYPRVRLRMVQSRPELLMTDAALELDDATLMELLPLVPSETVSLTKLISSLLPRNNEQLATVAFEQFSGVAAAQVVLAANCVNTRMADAWLHELTRRPRVLLQPNVMGLVSRTSLLYQLADALGWLTPVVASAGTAPWLAALINVSNDLPEEQEDMLYCFLVALALVSGGDSSLRVIEMFFDVLHGRVLKSRLSWHARNILLPQLPDLGWMRDWDLGRRLRMAVAAAYVRYEWSPQSYAALTGDRNVRAMLADAASDVPGGQPYAEAEK